MITSIHPVSHRIRIEWETERYREADISPEVRDRELCIVVRSPNLQDAVYNVNDQMILADGVGDPDLDGYTLIARDIIEYMTTGRHLPRLYDKLTEGPLAGVGKQAALAELIRQLGTYATLTPSLWK